MRGVPLLNFERGPGVPLLNFEEGLGSRFLTLRGAPGPGSWYHFYTMPWNLNNFSDFTNAFVRKENKRSYAQRSMRIKKLGKGGLCFITGCFIKPLKTIINHFYPFLRYIYNTQIKLIIKEKKFAVRSNGYIN